MKAYESTNIEPIQNDDIFTTLIKQETQLNEIFPNAVYLKNSTAWTHGSFYIYFYSKVQNICYINDLSFHWSLERLSVTNTIEQLSTKILPFIKMIQSRTINKKFQIPKFIYYHNRWYWSKEIVKQSVNLKPLFNEHNILYWFCEPSWNKWNIIINSDIDNMNNKDKERLKSKSSKVWIEMTESWWVESWDKKQKMEQGQ